jgi:hypothetical protein
LVERHVQPDNVRIIFIIPVIGGGTPLRSPAEPPHLEELQRLPRYVLALPLDHLAGQLGPAPQSIKPSADLLNPLRAFPLGFRGIADLTESLDDLALADVILEVLRNRNAY